MTASPTLSENIDRARNLVLPNSAVIDGEFRAARSGATFANVGPRDGRRLNAIAAGSTVDIDAAVVAARRAFEDRRWRGLGPRGMKKVLFRLAELMEADLETLALLECLDTGKPISDARNVDIPLSIGTTRWYAEALDKVYGEVGASPAARLSYAVHAPLGVIGAITPWNFPLHMAMWKVAPALAMGNSVVLKPAENSSMSALRMAELALQAGLPPGVLNVVPGLGTEAGEALARHMDVDMIAFTGSGPVGRALMRAAADSNLKRVSLELGGKSPQIVFADCPDLDAAAEAACWGVFYNQGEVCTAASRLLVEAPIFEAFLDKVVAVAKTIQVGDPLDPATRFGAMVSERQMTGVLDRIEDAKVSGARARLDGGRVLAETGGFYISPTIFDQVAPHNRLAKEEVFGPVLACLSFETEGEALALANDTVYGLAAGLWTANLDRALRCVDHLQAGLVWVNGWDACDIVMPFGGFKQSGFGRDRSLHALHKYADLKSVSITTRPA